MSDKPIQSDAPNGVSSSDLLGAFNEWWHRSGRFYDPDTCDVPWEDKRRFLAESAWNTAMAQSANYVANKECMPTSVTFANGRTVRIYNGYLEVDAPNSNISRREPISS